MRKGLYGVVIAACLSLPPTLGHAQETPPAKAGAPAQTATPPAATAEKTGQPAGKVPADPRAGASESRYRAWVDSEHAKDADAFQKDRSKIENKYSGYVRPKREKKDAKAESTPAKGN